MLMIQSVASNIDDAGERKAALFECRWYTGQPGLMSIYDQLKSQEEYLQPVNLSIMSKAEDELVNNAIDTHSSTDQLQSSVLWI
jgi:hypothetical protein